MGIMNRVVNSLIAVLAIVSVIFGYMLFEKREQLVKRGDTMAQTINSVATKLDSGSGTTYAENLQLLKLELDPAKDPNAPKNAAKTLYHTNYANLQSVLEPFKKQALDLIEQRDSLGSALNDVAVKLEIPQSYKPNLFDEIKTYKENKESLLDNVSKVNTRDNAIMKQIADSADVIGYSLDKETLKSLENYKTPLDEFAEKVSALKKRSDTFGEYLKKICIIFQIQEPTLKGEDYSQELSTASDALKAVKDDYEKTKTELADTKVKLEDVTAQLAKAETKVQSLEKTVAEKERKIKELMGEIDPINTVDSKGPTVDTAAALVEKLEGKVIELNPKWGFVVIDLGKNNKVMVGGKKKREEIVALPEGKVMLVGRNDQYVGKIKVVRVNENCAIANVVPEESELKLEPGDRVYFGKRPVPGAGIVTAAPADAAAAAPAAPVDAAPAAPAAAPADGAPLEGLPEL